jgi:hypothetical protein
MPWNIIFGRKDDQGALKLHFKLFADFTLKDKIKKGDSFRKVNFE